MLTSGLVDKIIISRPAVEAGEKLGFLPGDLKEKIDPYLRPIYDSLDENLSRDKVAKLIEKEKITTLNGVPTMTLEVMRDKNRNNYDLYVFFGINLIVYLPILLLKTFLTKKIVLRSTLVGTDDLESISKEKLGRIKVRIILLTDYYMAISKHIYDITQKQLQKFKTKICKTFNFVF